MTPYELDILLHYYCRCVDHPDVERDPPILRPTMEKFLALELVRYVPENARDVRCPMTYVLTDRGRVYCEALQQVPLPIWIVQWPTDTAATGERGQPHRRTG